MDAIQEELCGCISFRKQCLVSPQVKAAKMRWHPLQLCRSARGAPQALPPMRAAMMKQMRDTKPQKSMYSAMKYRIEVSPRHTYCHLNCSFLLWYCIRIHIPHLQRGAQGECLDFILWLARALAVVRDH